MAASSEDSASEVRQATTRITLPGTSFVPLACALGLVIAFVGLANWWVIFAVGAAIFVVALLRWINQMS